MRDVSPAEAERLDYLKCRWTEVRMEKLRKKLDDFALEYALQYVNLYEEIYGDKLYIQNAKYVDHDYYPGFLLRIISDSDSCFDLERLTEYHPIIAERLESKIDFRIISNDEIEVFIMEE